MYWLSWKKFWKKIPTGIFFGKMPVDQKIICDRVPMVSVEVERSFSMYKYILSDRRKSMNESNVAKLNVIQFNNFIDDDMEN